MESYVVRIYRRADVASDPLRGASIVGLVERPDSGATHPFHNFAELWEILRGEERKPPAGAAAER